MTRRKKEYKVGERATIYLNKDITPEMLEWINKQSDLSSFFLYAAKELYKQTGNIDLAEVLPRKINFTLEEGLKEKLNSSNLITHQQSSSTSKENLPPSNENSDNEEEDDNTWSHLNVDDDPFA